MTKNHIKINISILILFVFLFLLNTIILKNINIIFFNNHFNDFLAPFIFLSYVNIIIYMIIKKEINKLKYLILLIIFCSFMWEYIAIFLKPDSVFDIIDILCYILGTLIYWSIIKLSSLS